MTKYEEFKKIMEVSPLSEEEKNEIIEHAEVFFEFQDFMMKKHGISYDAVEKRSEMYINAKMIEGDNMKRFLAGDDNVLTDIIQQQADEEGFGKSLKESFKVIMKYNKK